MFEFDLATATVFISAPQPGILCLNSPHKQNVWPKMVLCSTARPRDMRPLEVWSPYYGLAFPTGRDSATFRDIGTEVSSLSQDKGTTGRAQNLSMGRDGPGQPVKIWDGTRGGTITIFLSKSGMGQGWDNHYDFRF